LLFRKGGALSRYKRFSYNNTDIENVKNRENAYTDPSALIQIH